MRATEDRYAAAWRRLRSGSATALALLIAPLLWAGATPSACWQGPMTLAAWLAALALYVLTIARFRCPRCAARFLVQPAWIWARRCAGCGLRRGSPAEPPQVALPARAHDLEATIVVAHPWEGGRSAPVASGLRCTLVTSEHATPAQLAFSDRDLALPGTVVHARLWLDAAAPAPSIRPGAPFALRLEGTPIAAGEVDAPGSRGT